jgi:hypothetical protein
VTAKERRRRLAGCLSFLTRSTERTTSKLPRIEHRIIRQIDTTMPKGTNIVSFIVSEKVINYLDKSK